MGVRMPPIISIVNLTKSYASGVHALKPINLEIDKGEWHDWASLIQGKNGDLFIADVNGDGKLHIVAVNTPPTGSDDPHNPTTVQLMFTVFPLRHSPSPNTR